MGRSNVERRVESQQFEFDKVEALVRRVQEGDRLAFEELYDLYFSQIYYVALRHLGSEDEATDVTQDVFGKVYGNIAKLKAPRAFHKWIHTITYNLCCNAVRHRETRESVIVEYDFASYEDMFIEEKEEFLPEEYLATKEESKGVVAIVDSLPEAQRNSVIMHYFEGFSVAEIAAITETTPGTVYKRLHDAKKTMRRKLGLKEEAAGGDLAKPVPVMGAVALPVLTQIFNEDASSILPEVSEEVKRRLLAWLASRDGTDEGDVSKRRKGRNAYVVAAVVVVALLAVAGIGGFMALRSSEGGELASTPSRTEDMDSGSGDRGTARDLGGEGASAEDTSTGVLVADTPAGTPSTGGAASSRGHQGAVKATEDGTAEGGIASGGREGDAVDPGDGAATVEEYSMQIVYHLRSLENEPIGRSSIVTGLTYGAVIDPGEYLNLFKPANNKYKAGVTDTVWSIVRPGLNEFHVYYPDNLIEPPGMP